MIELGDKIVAIWFLATIPGKQDWLAGLNEIIPDEKYKLAYRFRYYTGDQSKNPFDDEDEKHWYKGEVTGTRAYCIASLRMVAEGLKIVANSSEPLYELINDGDYKKFLAKFEDMPFVYSRQETRKAQATNE